MIDVAIIGGAVASSLVLAWTFEAIGRHRAAFRLASIAKGAGAVVVVALIVRLV